MGRGYTTLTTDVLVIGAGTAGLRAAVEAGRKGAKVIILNKASFPSGSSNISGGNMQASFGWLADDTQEIHFRDTVLSGKYLCDQSLVGILVEEAAQRIFDLEEFGVLFTRTMADRYAQTIGGGFSVPRSVMVGGRCDDVLRVLYRTATGYGARIYDQVMATNLIKGAGGAVAGAMAIDIVTGEVLFFKAGATILANGPCGRLFKITANTRSSTGDGFAMAYQCGAKLVNMEFMLFLPLGFIYPEFMKGVVLGELSSFGKNTKALNILGERFMQKYAPETMEKSTRDISSRASYLEIMEGRGTPSGGIIIDNSMNDLEESDSGPVRNPSYYRIMRDCLGDDIANMKKPLEAGPTALYCLGGIKINERCETSVAGLYAAGEAESNLHGANRLAGNSVIETQVFGARAGYHAADYATGITTGTPEPAEMIDHEYGRLRSFFDGRTGFRPLQLRKEIQEIMWSKVGIVRNSEGLIAAIRELEEIKRDKVPALYLSSASKRYNFDWVEAMEVDNMVIVAEMMARCALMRQESRGAHYRSDFAETDNANWLYESMVLNQNGIMQLSKEPLNLSKMVPEDAEPNG
jgi:fumarate reductase (CoM/CoB) subunit A